MLFSFLMTIKIMMGDARIDALEWRFCISGQTTKPLSMANPAPDWIEARDSASSVILNLPGSARRRMSVDATCPFDTGQHVD